MRRSLVLCLIASALVALPSSPAVAGSGGTSSGMTSADFNGDGFDDLAVGVSAEDRGSSDTPIENAGAVNVIYGSATGLGSPKNQLLDQGDVNPGQLEANDQFGTRPR